jgi:hypothetical protein
MLKCKIQPWNILMLAYTVSCRLRIAKVLVHFDYFISHFLFVADLNTDEFKALGVKSYLVLLR